MRPGAICAWRGILKQAERARPRRVHRNLTSREQNENVASESIGRTHGQSEKCSPSRKPVSRCVPNSRQSATGFDPRWIWPPVKLTLALLGALMVAAPNCIAAQDSRSPVTADRPGVTHALYVTIKSDDPDLTDSQHSSVEGHTATLTAKIRISDHSQETNFFGDVPATVSDFDPIKGSREQKVWEDAECHHERGFPKMTVVSIAGSIMNGQHKLTIDARARRIGLPLPADEVMAANRLAFGTDGRGSFVESHTGTKKSRILVDLKMYLLPCDIRSTEAR